MNYHQPFSVPFSSPMLRIMCLYIMCFSFVGLHLAQAVAAQSTPLATPLAAPQSAPLAATPSPMRAVEGIAAIVNDEVISLYDVDQRVDLFFATSGIQKNPEMQDRIRNQVLRSLVDEKLQLQEARRVEIAIEANEIEENIKRLAGENRMDLVQITEFLADNDIKRTTLEKQIEAELAWNQFVRRSFGGRINIGDNEINEQYKKAVRTVNQPRYLVSEILLNLDSFADERRITELSNEIVKQLQAGVDFAAVARQFSIAPSATRGGRLGWIAANQIDDALKTALEQMQAGQISQPIATNAGIYIIALADKQQSNAANPAKNRFDVMSVTFPQSAEIAVATNFANNFSNCRRAQEAANQAGAQSERTGLREIRTLPAAMRNAVINLEAGELSAPISTPSGTIIHIVCDRKDDIGVNISRDAIADNIYAQRVAMMARRHLRDLRRDAVVEYR